MPPNVQRYATTPYNFVPPPETVPPGEPILDRDRYIAGKHTGYLAISAETLTATYTRGAVGIGNDYIPPIATHGDQPADFFHYGDEKRVPVMPGSTVRGMARNIFEILTWSRMSQFDDRRYFYRSFADRAATGLRALYQQNFDKARLVAGLIERDDDGAYLRVATDLPKGFVLIDRKSVEMRYEKDWASTHRIFVTVTEDEHGILGVRIAKTMPPGVRRVGSFEVELIVPAKDVNERRWFQAVVHPVDRPTRTFRIPTDVFRDYLTWGQMAHGSRFGQRAQRTPRKLSVGSYAFAIVDENGETAEVIGANMMMPLRYQRGTREAAPESTRRADPDMDIAESVFGRISERAGDTIKTRVFFGDLGCVTPEPWLAGSPVRRPQALLGPKPTSFQLYLQQAEPNLVNWQSDNARIRGHKLYWHRSPQQAADLLDQNITELGNVDTLICPVRPGAKFTGTVRFENLTDIELYALYAALQLPDGLAHHIGMGKPLGMGSCRFTVEKVVLRDMVQRYSTFVAGKDAVPQENVNAVLIQGRQSLIRCVREPGARTLWGCDRLNALAAILAWDRRIPDEESDALDLDDPQWRERWALPEALDLYTRTVGPITVKDVIPAGARTESDARPEQPKPTRSLPPPTPQHREGDRITLAVTERAGYGGTVMLPDGKLLYVHQLGNANPGETAKFKITRITSGEIKAVARA